MTCPFQYERQEEEEKKAKKKMVVRLRIILFIIYLQKVSWFSLSTNLERKIYIYVCFVYLNQCNAMFLIRIIISVKKNILWLLSKLIKKYQKNISIINVIKS
jgi:hypothetical protein